MIRALHSRMDNMPTVGKYTRHKPMILQSKLQFKDGKQSAESSGGKVSPCATSKSSKMGIISCLMCVPLREYVLKKRKHEGAKMLESENAAKRRETTRALASNPLDPGLESRSCCECKLHTV